MKKFFLINIQIIFCLSLFTADVATAGPIGGGGGSIVCIDQKFVRKTIDESIPSNTTLQDDDALLFAIAASEVWQFEFVVHASSASDTPDIKFSVTFTGAAGATGTWGHQGIQSTATTTPSVVAVSRYVFDASSPSVGGVIAAADTPNRIVGVVVNSTTAGNIILQWAQNSSNATATTVKTGSYLLACRIS